MLVHALFYFAMGALFIYFGYNYASDTVFTPLSILFLFIASIDILLGFKQMNIYLKNKQSRK